MGRNYCLRDVDGGLYRRNAINYPGMYTPNTSFIVKAPNNELFHINDRPLQNSTGTPLRLARSRMPHYSDQLDTMPENFSETVTDLPHLWDVLLMHAYESRVFVLGNHARESKYCVHVLDGTQDHAATCTVGSDTCHFNFPAGLNHINSKMEKNVLGQISTNANDDAVCEFTTICPSSAHTERRNFSGMYSSMGMGRKMTFLAASDHCILMPTPFLQSSQDYLKAELKHDVALPSMVEFSPSQDIVAMGDEFGSVRLWDTRYFKRPYVKLESKQQHPVKGLAFSDISNELYVSRAQSSLDPPYLPWIESFSLRNCQSSELLIEPQIPLARNSERYLDFEGVWPVKNAKYTLPNERRDSSSDPHRYVVSQGLDVLSVDSMLVQDRRLVVGSQVGIMYIDIPPIRLTPKRSRVIWQPDGTLRTHSADL